MTRRSPIQTTPRSTKTRAFRGMSRQEHRPGNPKKAQRQRVERRGEVHQHDLLQCACRRRAHDLRGQTLPHCQRCLAPHQRRHLGSRDGDCLRLAQSPHFLSSSAASFRFTELLWQHLKPIMSITHVAAFWRCLSEIHPAPPQKVRKTPHEKVSTGGCDYPRTLPAAAQRA